MKHTKASHFPQELLGLFHQHKHGHTDRRSFLDGVGRLAGTG